MAATEGKRTLFKNETLCAVLSLLAFCFLSILSLGIHIKFGSWCSFTTSIFTYLINVGLFGFGLTIFSFHTRIISVLTIYFTIVFLFFLIAIILLGLTGKIEGRRLDE